MVHKKTATRKKAGSRKPSGKAATKKTKKTTLKNRDKRSGKGSNVTRESEGKLILDESLTIATAENLKKTLGEYSGKYHMVELDGTHVEQVDTAALQVLTSFIMQSERESVEIRWLGKSDALEKTAALLGLTGHLRL